MRYIPVPDYARKVKKTRQWIYRLIQQGIIKKGDYIKEAGKPVIKVRDDLKV